MSIKCFPLAGEQNYGVIDFQSYLGSRIQGVYNGATNLQVTAQDPAAMAVNVSAGLAWLKTGALAGVTFRMDAGVELVVEAADALQDRIDTVVVGLDLVNRTGYCEVVKGLIGGGATPPVRDASYYELVLAEISVTAAMSSVTTAKITDKREDNDVCGYMRDIINANEVTVINNLTTSSASNALSAGMGKQLQDEKAPKANPTFTGAAVLPNSQLASADITGYTNLGTGAPQIKMKKLTGTTGPTTTSIIRVSHGLNREKILFFRTLISVNVDTFYMLYNSCRVSDHSFTEKEENGDIVISNAGPGTESKPYICLIIYEA